MKVRTAKDLLHDSLVNGEGIRTTIFFAGCDKRCYGCHNKELQDFNAGVERDIDDLVNEILENKSMIDGVTLSGGDPMYQKEAATELCKKLKDHNINIWLYTGNMYEDLMGLRILSMIDVIVDGQFIESQKSENIKYRGSSNQKIMYLKEGIPVKIIEGEMNGYE